MKEVVVGMGGGVWRKKKVSKSRETKEGEVMRRKRDGLSKCRSTLTQSCEFLGRTA